MRMAELDFQVVVTPDDRKDIEYALFVGFSIDTILQVTAGDSVSF